MKSKLYITMNIRLIFCPKSKRIKKMGMIVNCIYKKILIF
ncbi:Uncharacterized protein dnl_06310 [Desulfonema limicola]|uniref:Uncharacterized protein n=1 Tax=Desulfonema limicola TaxID=45656 RepID=A0A975B418_9BACT|nr:Uncharacterized protein dnl_06310 [Desulfonema limicola]